MDLRWLKGEMYPIYTCYILSLDAQIYCKSCALMILFCKTLASYSSSSPYSYALPISLVKTLYTAAPVIVVIAAIDMSPNLLHTPDQGTLHNKGPFTLACRVKHRLGEHQVQEGAVQCAL